MQEQTAQPAATAPTLKDLAGFDEGHVLIDGSIVRGDYDENGVLAGWHKEPPAQADGGQV